MDHATAGIVRLVAAQRIVHRDIGHLEAPLVQYVAIALSQGESSVTIKAVQ